MEDLSVLQMENKLYEALEAFCCFKDKDIENFLRIKAVEENYGFSELQFDRDHFQLFKRI